jgi:ADP-glucose pyrophosphorylase
MFVASKKKIISLLEKYRGKLAQSEDFLSDFFKHILAASFESIEDISGKVLFHYNLMQYFKENLDYIDYSCTKGFLERMQRFKGIEESLKEAYVGTGGVVKNSFISHGVEVYGYVENSILFPNVSVMKDSHIVNSVILNNNKIGHKSTIKNALILPFLKSDSSLKYNIEDGCHIGEISSSIKNSKYPEQVNNGMTTLGMNIRIPKGYVIEPGCFIDADVPLNKVKQYTKLSKGESIVNL